MKSVCVYLGAAMGNKDIFRHSAECLAKELVKRDCTLVYGGSSLGMMGLLASTVKKLGGNVVGVITNYLVEKELPSLILNELHIVNTMHERKKMMQAISDTFLVMPGGLGTLEEAMDTWNSIKTGEIKKSIGFLNIDGYFDELFSFLETCRNSGFLNSNFKKPFVHTDINCLLNDLISNCSDNATFHKR